ncbi:MAG: efflux RND transporter periplasmic adaptor subunit [Deltaproteobacteria bacterium]|nr:efflux RND transporter periplasmic adaptor subunit [Deltaproteobacteria bacterium]
MNRSTNGPTRRLGFESHARLRRPPAADATRAVAAPGPWLPPVPRIVPFLFVALAAAIAGVAAIAACGGPGVDVVRLEQGGLVLEISLEPRAPRVGANALTLALRDAAGAAIDGAHVEASVRMPAMGAMAAMGGPAAIEPLGDGRYRADFELAMGSTWQVEIAIRTAPARSLRAEGSLTVGSPGLRLAALPARGAAREPAATSTHPGEVVLTPDRLQRSGIGLARAEKMSLSSTLRVVGRVVAPESELVDVSLKLRGWAARVLADAVGVAVRRGDVLFEVDSPELTAAASEYVEALRSQARARDTSAPDRADALASAARSRLTRFGVDDRELERLARTLEVGPTLPIRAPISGFVVEKNLVRGSAFEAGERLYRLAPLTTVWVEAEVYEADLARVDVGLSARITPAHDRGHVFEAPVTLLSPGLDPDSRTTRVRIAVANPELTLRPDQFVDVELALPGAEAIVVPLSAVLQAGTRSFVFLALGDGRFRPQPVEPGRRVGEAIEIRSGLADGDTIVRSGTFLIAAESRLRAALEQW